MQRCTRTSHESTPHEARRTENESTPHGARRTSHESTSHAERSTSNDYNSSRMSDVAIVGAGSLGGTLAHTLARSDVAACIRLVDDYGQVAKGKALDIMQASPIERFATAVSGSPDVTVAAGSSLFVIADPARGGEWSVDEGLLIIKRLMRMSASSVIVCAGAAGREMVERGVRELRVGRERLFGSAPEALGAAIRAVVAIEANRSPRDVALAVLGVPPSHVVLPWEDATIGGFAAVRVLDVPARRRIDARIAPLWPPGPVRARISRCSDSGSRPRAIPPYDFCVRWAG